MAVLASIIIRDVVASRPAAGIAGRLFFATDTEVAYYDDGTSWDVIMIGSGSVASVALTVPSWLSVAGSPVTSSGTLAVTATGGETANEFLATPDGTTGTVGLRTIVAGDLPLATTSLFGAVKPDGSSITISGGVITAPAGAGTVTSVALTVPSDYSVSGSPVTTTGTLAISENTQAANLVKAGPVSGSAAVPTYRSLEPADLPAATTGALGAVQPDGATIDVTSGVISVPTATTSLFGLVKPDGTTVDVSAGVISVPTATTGALGLVKPDGSTITISSGVITGKPGTVTSVALTTPGWLTVGGSPITSSGTLAVTATSGETANEFLATPDGTTGAVGLRSIVAGDLPHATTGAFGAVKPDGTSIGVSSGVISTVNNGTVTSVALTVPSWLSVGGSPVTGAGTLAITENTQSANQIFAGPASGSAAAPGFRSVAAADLPLATTGAFGAVKPDGSTVDITSGVISVPTATSSVLGLVKPDGATIDVSSGVISVPTSTTSLLGLVKPDGTTVTIASGVISSTGMANPMTTPGDLIIGGTSGTPTRLASGTSGDVLTSNGTSAAPSWGSPSGGGSGSTISIGTMASFISSPPAGPAAGDTFRCSDTRYSFIYTGSAWQAYWDAIPVTLPAQAQGEATTLAGNGGSINGSITTINVAATYSASTPFLAIVDTEVVKVTSKGSGTDWTVVRGYDSTAATHFDATAITLLNWQELNTVSFFVNYPGSGSTPVYGGLNVLAASGSYLVKRLAPSTPYTITAAIQPNIVSDTDDTGFGLMFRDSSSGKITTWDLGHSTTWQYQSLKMSDPNTVNSAYTVTQPTFIPLPYSNVIWLQIQDDGTSLTMFFSFDSGITWTTNFDVSRTDYAAPDEIGFWVYGAGASTGATLLHWAIS